MKFDVPYGAQSICSELEWAECLGTLTVADPAPMADPAECIRAAIEHPLGLEGPAYNTIRKGDTVAIIVSDSFRQTRADPRSHLGHAHPGRVFHRRTVRKLNLHCRHRVTASKLCSDKNRGHGVRGPHTENRPLGCTPLPLKHDSLDYAKRILETSKRPR